MARIVHLGLGNFHRAHQACYTHRANQITDQKWAIVGVAMRSHHLRDQMAAADWGYDLGILGTDGLNVERITVHEDVRLAASDSAGVLNALSDPETRVVTLTVTEKGYTLRPDGHLDTSDPGIASDLAGHSPQTPIGLLATALHRRHVHGAPRLTILSCDNLAGNGHLLQRAVADFAHAADMPTRIVDGAEFPCSMVDRITPATTDAIALRMVEAAGRPVVAPVLTEAFSEWVIEDQAAGPLPDWAAAGALLVPDVAPYERRKLLMLNAAHSALAYGGLCKGLIYVHEAIANPVLRDLVEALWDEAGPLLPEFSVEARHAHGTALIDRFSVTGMEHRLDQIATDGTAKLPQRILPILRHHGFQAPSATKVLRLWWQSLIEQTAKAVEIRDPKAHDLSRAVTSEVPEADRFGAALAGLGLDMAELPQGWRDRCLAPDTP